MSTYTAWSVTFGEQPSAAKWNILGTNMAYFYELLNGTNGIDGWTALGIGVSSVTYNGNRNYTLTMSSSIASVLSPLMRIRTTSTVSAPTQCTSLNGSTQYWVKTSPNKLTFTDDFVVSAWIKLSSYNAANMVIASRWNGTSGWSFEVNSDGTVELFGTNAGSANISRVQSYQSIPLNKWVHVTAQLDMSSFTVSSTTSYVMIDGVDVPALVIRGGTNPTALIQAGNLEIGSRNSGTEFFPGKIAQVAIFNAKVTQSTIRGYISQGLSGSETSLASAYSFNNSTSDLNTTTPNDLSAGAGAPTATNSDSPFAQDSTATPTATSNYGIVMSASSTTLVLQVPEGCTIPTSGGVSSVSYATSGVPYKFPSDRFRWTIEAWFKVLEVVSFGGTATWTASAGSKITVPIGQWAEVGYVGAFQLHSTVAGARHGHFTLASSAPTNGTYTQDYTSYMYQGASVVDAVSHYYRSVPQSLSSSLTYTVYGSIVSSTGTESYYAALANGPLRLYAVPAGV